MFHIQNIFDIKRCITWRHWTFEIYLLCLTTVFTILLLSKYQHINYKFHAVCLEPELNDSLVQLVELLGPQDVRLFLVDPGILWDMLSGEDAKLLSGKGLVACRRKDHEGLVACRRKDHEGLLSLALFEEDLPKVMAAYQNSRLVNQGFRTLILKSDKKEWMKNATYVRNGYFVSHVLLFRYNTVLHLSVFYNRGDFYWCGQLENYYSLHTNDLLDTGLVFGIHDVSFDRFQLVRSTLTSTTLYVPSFLSQFLWQMSTSRFLECLDPGYPVPLEGRNHIPMDFFIGTARAVVQEMKELTRDNMTHFWLASGTLLGWYRQCGLIPYTHDMDFSAWAKDLNDHLLDKLIASKNFEILNMLGEVSEDFELWLRYKWLRVDLFFAYGDKDAYTVHVGGHRPEEAYSFRYSFPNLTLCSGDFYGDRVLVPCDPASIIAAEYGADWRVPKSSWNYEFSARNVVGRRYWSDSETRRVIDFQIRRKNGY